MSVSYFRGPLGELSYYYLPEVEGENKSYSERRNELMAKLIAAGEELPNETALYHKNDGTFFTKTRKNTPGETPSKKFWITKDAKPENFQPVLIQRAADSNPIIVVEGEKAGIALALSGGAARYSIYCVGSVINFSKGRADFALLDGRDLIFWPDYDKDGEPQGWRNFHNNLVESGIKPKSIGIVQFTGRYTDAADCTKSKIEYYLVHADRTDLQIKAFGSRATFATTQTESDGDETPDECFDLLMKVDPRGMNREEWQRWLSRAKAVGISAEQCDTWSSQDPDKYEPTEIRRIWDGLNNDGQIKRGSFFYGLDEEGITFKRRANKSSSNEEEESQKSRRQKEQRRLYEMGWLFNNNRPLSSSVVNAELALTELEYSAKYDEWYRKLIVVKDEVEQEFAEKTEIALVKREMEVKYQPVAYTPTSTAVLEAAGNIGQDNKFDIGKEYLDRCYENWDGKTRLETIGEDYFCQIVNEELYEEDGEKALKLLQLKNEIAKLLILGMGLRAYKPGSHFPYMVIIAGKQGKGKTKALKVLAPIRYVRGMSLNSFNPEKELQERVRGANVVEIGEHSTIGPKEHDKLKALITDNSTTNREAYDKEAVTRLFTHIFVATTNEYNFLHDDENRRFVVLEIPGGDEYAIDIDGLARDKDHLFGEFMHLFHQDDDKYFWDEGEQNYVVTLPEEMWALAAEDSETFASDESLEEFIIKHFQTELDDGDDIPSITLHEHLLNVRSNFPGYRGLVPKIMAKMGRRLVQVRRKDNPDKRQKVWRVIKQQTVQTE